LRRDNGKLLKFSLNSIQSRSPKLESRSGCAALQSFVTEFEFFKRALKYSGLIDHSSLKSDAEASDEEPKEFPLPKVKVRALSQIQMVSKHDRDHQLNQSLTLHPDLEPSAAELQKQSKQIISSLYCQILLSPMSASFRV
jgi:hypothetical protein